MRIYAIGDIHGHLDKLEAAHARIAADRSRCGDDDAPVVHLGDLVDRGPESAGVLDYLIEGRASGAPWVTVQGNHDAMFLDFLEGIDDAGSDYGLSWASERMGGAATLASYGLKQSLFRGARALRSEAKLRVPEAHRAFLQAMPNRFATRDILFVHAGIRPGVAISAQEESDLLWIRQPFLSDTRDHGLLVVHGHTPVDEPHHCGNRVNLDTGAGFGRALTAAVFEGRDCWVLTDEGRVPLPPPRQSS